MTEVTPVCEREGCDRPTASRSAAFCQRHLTAAYRPTRSTEEDDEREAARLRRRGHGMTPNVPGLP